MTDCEPAPACLRSRLRQRLRLRLREWERLRTPSCDCLAGHAKLFLLFVTGFSTLVFFALSIWTYVVNGVVYPCPGHRHHLSQRHSELSVAYHHHHYVTMPLVRVSIAMLGALVMEFYSASAHLQLTSWLGLAFWQMQVGSHANMLVRCHKLEVWALDKGSSVWFTFATILTSCVFLRVVYERWLTLEITSGGQRREGWRCCFLCFAGYALLGAAGFAAVFMSSLPFEVLVPVFLLRAPTMLTCFVCLAWPNLRLILEARRAASKAALPRRARRIQWAASAVLLQFVGSLAAGSSSFVHAFVQVWGYAGWLEGGDMDMDGNANGYSYGSGNGGYGWLLRDLASLLDVCCNTFLLLASAGILSGAGQSARLRNRAARARQGRWRRNWETWQRRVKLQAEARADDSDSDSDGVRDRISDSLKIDRDSSRTRGLQLQWDEKVRELAGRGVSLDALLVFYRQTLPAVMPHFDPDRHTTEDVVFEAVIPYTSEAGCPAAELMMAGESALPQTMVTHLWGNKFSHLLAAILSDAIGESDFGMVAWLLARDPDRLAAWIADRQVGSRTYWVCAFAVNQHISICGGRGKVCGCNRHKVLNDFPPLMGNGSSIPCELNKFDCMMKYLSAENPAFEQLVAVDERCDLFWRAWCMAEIAAARESGMQQALKVTSPDCLEANLERLGQLKIEDMHASRQEDKELILGHIESPKEFNATLQHTLLNEVIPAWTSLDASEQMSLAGCIIRWQRLSQQISDPAVWAA